MGSQLEVHITGRHGAELAPDHLRQILTAPTTEFKAISFVGVTAGLLLAIALRKHSPRTLRRLTLVIAVLSVAVFLAGYAS